MGTSKNVAELTGKLSAAQAELKDGVRPALNAAADAAGQVMLTTARAARTKGITVRKKQFTAARGEPAVNVRYGPNAGWVAIQNDKTQPHFIARRGGRGSPGRGQLRRQNLTLGNGARRNARAGRLLLSALGGAFGTPSGRAGAAGVTRGAINIKGVGPRAYAFHPGNRRAKKWVGRGVGNGLPVAVREYEQRQVANFSKPFT